MKLLAALAALVALASAHPGHHSKLSPPASSSAASSIAGTAAIVVWDILHDDGTMECVVYVEVASDDGVMVVKSDLEAHELPFVAGDRVQLAVADHPTDKNLKVLRDVESVVSGKAQKTVPLGVKSVLQVVVDYNDAPSFCDAACVAQKMYTGAGYNVNEMYLESSYGSLGFFGDTVTISRGINIAEEPSTGLQSLIAVYNPLCVAAGFNPDTYDMVQYQTRALGTGIGVAYVGGRESFVNSQAPDTFAHEMGHNFGFWHSGSDPNDDLEVDDTYLDFSCCMGYQIGASGILRGFNVEKRLQAGWLTEDNVHDVASNICETVQIHALSTDISGAVLPHAVRAGRDVAGTTSYYLSYRNAVGYDAFVPGGYGQNSINIHNEAFVNDNRGSSNSGYVGSVSAGASWSSSVSAFNVTVLSLDEDTATIRVCGPDSNNPPVEENPCANNDEGIISLAFAYHIPFAAEITGCDYLAAFCTHSTYGSFMRDYCPTTCGACSVNDECVYNDDNLISLYASAAGFDFISSCAQAIAYVPTACTHQTYGSFMNTACPCTCA